MIKRLYKDGKSKALTFSFDDGASQDIRLAALFDKYKMKCTFNFSGGKCGNQCFLITDGQGKNEWDGSDALRECFKNHEIASHSFTHFHPVSATDDEIKSEIEDDIKTLSKAMGYKIRGFASPFGEYDDRLLNVLEANGICFHRTVNSTLDFKLPENFLTWNPSCHFATFTEDKGKKLIDSFLDTTEEMPCLYIWGHSFEITNVSPKSLERWNGNTKRWDLVENNILKPLADKDDIWCATNIEICDYVTDMRKAVITDEQIENPTDTELFFLIDGKVTSVPPKKTVKL